ncbi:MAG: N-acetyltransferase [Betaproteobacteria bacterium]|nr:N-acetyltransferase [Betaproteobacteria bacterium]
MERDCVIELCTNLGDVAAAEWDRLTDDHPALRHAFLHALHETGCATAATGWIPRYLLLRRAGTLAAAMPLYLKTHSYGEYVFDWAWAEAYERHRLAYYPKLVCAIPFTPVSGPRLLAASEADRVRLLHSALALARDEERSSLHVLFADAAQAREIARQGLLLRRTVQFHWVNQAYPDFEAFLGAMNHEKRKKIRQERRKVRDTGVRFVHLKGDEAGVEDWAFFYDCYRRTYRQHGGSPYLTRSFFSRIARSMPNEVLLMIGHVGAERLCASLHLVGGGRLYGRYWGTQRFVPGLHFEACYYQAIDYCITHGIATFEGGAQGEHKLARGLEPVATFSNHWLAHPAFAHAVEDFLVRETRGVEAYLDELTERAPFKAVE